MGKIAIDIDNTICNSNEFFGPIALKYDREVLHKNNDIDYSAGIPKSNAWSEEELKYYFENYFSKQVINIPIKEDAVTYINKLKRLGFEIVFITKRGFKDYDHSDLIIPDYLKMNNILYDDIITGSVDKYKYLGDCDYFIDDAFENCEQALEKTGAKVIMIKTDRTKDYNNDKVFKANNWQEIFEYITN